MVAPISAGSRAVVPGVVEGVTWCPNTAEPLGFMLARKPVGSLGTEPLLDPAGLMVSGADPSLAWDFRSAGAMALDAGVVSDV